MLGYASSLVGATLKTVALQVATTALNAAITMGASLIVGGIITAISNWVRQDEILAEKAETAKQKIDELNNNYKEHSQLVSDSAKRYAELAQGVDQFSGKNLSLNDDDYKEFLDLSNQLAEAFPTLSRHYDENGNTILQLSGNVDTIVGSLNNLIEAERSVKNQEIADELPTVYKNANNKSDDYKKQIDELKEQRQTLIDSLGDVQSDDFSKNFIDGLEKSMISVEGENLETLSKMKDDYLKILKDANIDIDYEELMPDYENKGGVDAPVRFNIKINSSEEDIEKAKKTIKANVENLASEYEGDISELNDKIQSVQDKNKANWSSLTGSIAAWLDTEDSYKTMSDDMQSTIQNIVNNLDWSKLNFSSWEKAKQYISDNILSLFQTSDGKDVLKKIEVMFGIQTQFNNGEITVNEYQKKLKTFLDEISTLAPDTQKAIKLIFGISTDKDGTTTSSIDTMVNNVKSKLKDKFDDKVGELSLDDLQVASKFEIPEGTLLSWDELKQKIEETKNAASEETTISLADINKTKSGIGGLFDKYEQNEGYLTQDEVASVLETNPEYIQYLVKVGDQYKLNEQALNDWNEANKEQEQEINNQMGGNDYLGNYSSLLDSIQDNASHPNGGVGNTNIGSQLDDLINKNKEWNTSLQNGEITTAQYFQNMSNAITDSGLEDALHSLNGTFDDSTDYIEETVSVLTTQLSDGLTQSTKRFEEGQTSVQDYIKEINAGSDAEKKLLASTYNLDISQETGKASLDGLSDSALEAAQSYNSLVDSQNALAGTSGFVDVLSQNADFLSQYTDEAGNLMDIEGMIVGDVYHTSDDGKEYVYTGEGWELLGFTIDLSAYATTESVTKAINNKFSEITKSLENYYNKDQIDGKVTELTGAIATAKQEAITAAATDAQSKADKAFAFNSVVKEAVIASKIALLLCV